MIAASSKRAIQIGDVVITPNGGPAMRVTGFGFMRDVVAPGPSATLESLRRDENDETKPAWLAELLVAHLRVLPEGHYARKPPYYDWGDGRGLDTTAGGVEP